jgi:putative protein kinase ArgK-like GTPase of G3E family
VISTAADKGDGIDQLTGALDSHRAHLEAGDGLEARRREGLRNRTRFLVEEKISGAVWGNSYIRRRFDAIFSEVVSNRLSPYEAAEMLAEPLRIDEKSR